MTLPFVCTPPPPSCQLNQHLTDSLCQQLLQLDEVAILDLGGTEEEGEGEGDMEQQVGGWNAQVPISSGVTSSLVPKDSDMVICHFASWGLIRTTTVSCLAKVADVNCII